MDESTNPPQLPSPLPEENEELDSLLEGVFRDLADACHVLSIEKSLTPRFPEIRRRGVGVEFFKWIQQSCDVRLAQSLAKVFDSIRSRYETASLPLLLDHTRSNASNIEIVHRETILGVVATGEGEAKDAELNIAFADALERRLEEVNDARSKIRRFRDKHLAHREMIPADFPLPAHAEYERVVEVALGVADDLASAYTQSTRLPFEIRTGPALSNLLDELGVETRSANPW
ncbi:MAG: hypothetical protein AAF488_04615 [Planctomycetota bacterium]